MTKTYPFSLARHGHDLMLAYNLLFTHYVTNENATAKLQNWATETRNRLAEIMNNGNGRIAFLTGEQIGLAKRAIEWAIAFRDERNHMTTEEINAAN